MDFRINKEALSVNEIAFDGCQEQPIDLDFSLPDYCPDIQRILKCQVYPRVNMRSISGDRLDVEGIAVVRLLYLDAGKMTVRCCEHSTPFSCSFHLKSMPMNANIFTKTRVEYINCRAVSPRKLDIHGAFSVCARIVCRTRQELLCGVEGDSIEQKKRKIPASHVLGSGQQQFGVSEVLELGQGKPPAESIIRSDVTAVVHDYKAIANKLILKGEALIKVLYVSDMESGEMNTMEYAVPISQIVDVDGVEEGSVCDARLDVLNHDLQIRTDSMGDDTLLAAELKLVATVDAYAQSEVELVTDAYSTEVALDLEKKQTTIEQLVELIGDTFIDKKSLDLSEGGISSMIDLWNEMAVVSAHAENGQLLFKGKLNACILGMDAENTPMYLERVIDFEMARDWSGRPENIRCDCEVSVLSMNYRISSDGSLEVKTELKITAAVYAEASCQAVVDVVPDESRPMAKDTSAALTIYYADAGEALWNIARAYCTSVEAIKRENDLDCDILEDRGMLLIPM